jgi:uncharacterized membrane protein YkgB
VRLDGELNRPPRRAWENANGYIPSNSRILGLIVTTVGGALAVSYMSAYVMVLSSVLQCLLTLFLPLERVPNGVLRPSER